MENEQRELDLRERFSKYHQYYRHMADCNMKEIAKEMGIPRCRLYRWLKGKTHLDEAQQEYIKKLLTNSAFGFIISYATTLPIIAL